MESLARQPFLKNVERHEPLIKKSGVYIVKAQIVYEAVEAVMQDEYSQMSRVQTEGLSTSQNSQRHVYQLKD